MTLVFTFENQPAALCVPDDRVAGLSLRCGVWSLYVADPVEQALSQFTLSKSTLDLVQDVEGELKATDATTLLKKLLGRDYIEADLVESNGKPYGSLRKMAGPRPNMDMRSPGL